MSRSKCSKELMHEMKKADAISPEACRRVGMGSTIYPAGQNIRSEKAVHSFIMGDSATAEAI